jgi:hypothetical protein
MVERKCSAKALARLASANKKYLKAREHLLAVLFDDGSSTLVTERAQTRLEDADGGQAQA